MLKKLVLFFSLLGTMNVYAAGVSQEMDVVIGMFDAAKIKFEYDERGGRYDIQTTVQTANLFDTLYPFKGKYQSVGKVLRNGDLMPEEYIMTNETRRHVRGKNVLYDKKGKAYKSVAIKDGREKISLINDAPQTADVADLQTVFAELIKNFSRQKSCALVREIYDRKKHYKVVSRDVRREKRYFEGLEREENTYLCSLYIENLKDNNDNVLWDVSADRPISVWLSYDEKAKMPFLLEIKIDSTPLGELKVSPRTLEFR